VAAGLVPRAWSRLNIFLSYASEHRRIAEEIAQTLKNSGHQVFFDRESLSASQDYNDRIRSEIDNSDRFVFLVSRSALQEGRFTLSELQFAKERWPAPAGRVFPVLLDKTIKPEELPTYLRSVQALSIYGNPTAEIANEIDKTRRLRPAYVAALFILALGLLGGGAWGMRTHLTSTDSEVVFSPPSKVDFRPLIAPPEAGGQADAWLASDVVLSALQFGYQHMTSAGAKAQILPERVELRIDGSSTAFDYRYEVNITSKCREGGWHCPRDPKSLRTLEPGDATSFQNMFRSSQAARLTWQAFIDKVSAAKQNVSVIFLARINIDRKGRMAETQVRHECVLNFTQMQKDIADTREKRGRIPIILQPSCAYR